MTNRKTVIFGDSILRPIILDERNRYSLSKAVDFGLIERRLNISIENRSRMGATIKYGHAKLLEYLQSEKEEISSMLIEYGGNDCDYDWQTVSTEGTMTHLPKTSPAEFEDTLNLMIDELKKRGIKPILMTLPPISAPKYYRWFMKKGLDEDNVMRFLGDVDVIYRHQEFYSGIIQKTAFARGTDLVDVRNCFLLRRDFSRLLCEDGVHPNLLGQQIIMKAFIDKYERNKKYKTSARLPEGDIDGLENSAKTISNSVPLQP